jgi:hypothetical protein
MLMLMLTSLAAQAARTVTDKERLAPGDKCRRCVDTPILSDATSPTRSASAGPSGVLAICLPRRSTAAPERGRVRCALERFRRKPGSWTSGRCRVGWP